MRRAAIFIPAEAGLNSERFREWLADDSVKKSTFDVKRAIVALKWKGLELRGIDFDLLLAAYLLDPSETDKDFSRCCEDEGCSCSEIR
ncbi:hypothetical protein GCM10020331_032590 [Ectobacillus funiculus]